MRHEQRRLAQLQRENALLREALNWYACKVNWCRRAVNPKGSPRRWEKSPAAFDRGGRARVVVQLIEDKRIGPLQRLFLRLMGRPLPSTTITTPAPLQHKAPEPWHSSELPTSSTESSTTPAPDAERSGTTADSADTPGATA